jgi:hypothetical protein
MQHSSLGLAVAFAATLAAANSASAGFHPMHGFAPAHHVAFGRHFGPIAPFHGHEAHMFHQGRDRAGLFFSAGSLDVGGAASPAAVESSNFGSDGPAINVTITPPAQDGAYSRQQSHADSFGPKIIVIGGHTRPANAKKMPVVVYGVQPDRTY